MTLSPKGFTELKDFEGVVLLSYPDSGGVWTIGIGSTEHPNGTPVVKGEKITLLQANQYVAHDLIGREYAMGKVVKKILTQAQHDATVCLCYNIGIGNFASSSVVRSINNDPTIANKANIIHNWKKFDEIKGHHDSGLKTRREKELFIYFEGAVSMNEILLTV